MSSVSTTANASTISITTPRGITGKVGVRGEQSTGTPIVYFHGATGLLAEEPFLDALSETHSVFAPEWPSFGVEETETSVEDMLDFTLHGADLVTSLAANYGWASAPIVIGNDMGAMIAAEMACLNPASMGHLVLISPFGLWDDTNPIPDMFTWLPFEFPERLFHDVELGTRLLASGLNFEDVKAIEAFQIRNARQLGTAGKIMFPIPNRRLSKRLYRCDTPTTIAWGAQDRLTITEPYSELWQKSIPHATTLVIENAGHMVHLEKPAELAEKVRALL
jgi:pimeloyl-ACP methyl ester carboxylesterase